jgi:DeoR/GlpR family transcriptional regulator of sugar metabolism
MRFNHRNGALAVCPAFAHIQAMIAKPSSRAGRLAPNRHNEILKQISLTGVVSVGELAEYFDVSRETIRRDLKQLAARNQLDIVHGGAARPEAEEPPYEFRSSENAEGKAVIAQLAVKLVADGMVVLLDSGTTTLAIAKALRDRRDLTIITTSLAIAQLLCRQPGMRVHLIGGEVSGEEMATTGLDMVQALANFRVDIAFIGVGGMGNDGEVTDYTRIGAEQRSRMIEIAAKAYFVLDRTKFGRLTPMRFRAFLRASGVIVDASPPSAALAGLAARRIKAIYP